MNVCFKKILVAALLFAITWHCIAVEKGKPSWKFCVTGDSRGSDKGINSEVLKRLVTELKKEKPEYVIFVGDLVNGYTGVKKLTQQLTYWRDTFMTPLLDANIAVYSSRGNHDLVKRKRDMLKSKKSKAESTDKLSRDVWNQIFSGKYQLPQNGPEKEKNITYKITGNNAVVLCLDTYMPGKKNRINQKWFAEEVKKVANSKTPLHLFAFAHPPAYSVRHKDCLDDYPEKRDEMVKTFLDAGGVAMFFGHDHRYNHAMIPIGNKKLHQFVVGTAGAPLRKWDGKYADPTVKKIVDFGDFGYMLVEINGNQATLTMKGWNKDDKQLKVIDTFKYELE